MSNDRAIYTNIGYLWPKSGKTVKYTGRIQLAAPMLVSNGTVVILDPDPNRARGTMRLTLCLPPDPGTAGPSVGRPEEQDELL